MKRKLSTRIVALSLTFLLGASTPLAVAAVSATASTQKVTVDGTAAAVSAYNVGGSNYFKLRDLASELDFGVSYNDSTRTISLTSDGHYKASATTLITGNWAPATRTRIQSVITANANKGRYVVFDFDNTSVINDVEEALAIYQLENLRFKIKPTEMASVLETQIPDLKKAVGTNAAGGEVTCTSLITDIVSDYTWLYNNYKGFTGKYDLNYIHATNQYQDFVAKMRYMYTAVGDTFDASVSYPWVTYWFTGMTPQEVYDLAAESHAYWGSYGNYGEVTWTSPVELPGKAGVVTIDYLNGLTFTDELKDLYATLMANGIDVYIVSASFIDVIRAANVTQGYNIPEDHVFAMRNVLKNGVYTNEYDYNWGGEGKYAQTQAEGKSTVITNFIASKYNSTGPLMVFGDSKGDYWMMTDWMAKGDTQLGVIFNRYRKTSDPIWKCSKEAADTIGSPTARFVLQGRDNNTGELIPTEYSRMLGSSDLVLVRPAS